jgi:hypothetical protein
MRIHTSIISCACVHEMIDIVISVETACIIVSRNAWRSFQCLFPDINL